MKMNLILFLLLISYSYVSAQSDVEIKGESKIEIMENLDIEGMTKSMKYELAMSSCDCIDSIRIGNKSRDLLSKEVSACIQKASDAYMLSSALGRALNAKPDSNNVINITISENGGDKKQAYVEIERILMDSCKQLQELMTSNDKESLNSVSTNKKALQYYYKGMDAFKAKQLTKAAKYYEKAVGVDKNFAFAWDNLGLTYRYLKKYKKALAAYKTSLQVSPTGTLPLQNIPIVYQYMEKPELALDAYNKLTRVLPDNPEGYFGKGRLLAGMNKMTPALHSICQAYNIYDKTNNPYRTDAEKVIGYIYGSMGKSTAGKKKFYSILEQYAINLKIEE